MTVPATDAPLKPKFDIEWQEGTVRLQDLIPYERNPRRISAEAFAKLKSAIKKLGYHQRIIIQPDMTVIGGHQRLRALHELGVREVNVLIPSRPLTQDEYRQLLVQDNLPFGEFDFELLANDFDADALLYWGMNEKLIDQVEEIKLAEPESEGTTEKKVKECECPKCGYMFAV